MQRVLDAIDAFWEYLASVELRPLAIAIACHVLKLACTSRAWRNVLAAAYPQTNVRWRSIYAAYVSGVGVNAIFPARAGDVVRLYLAHRAIPDSTYTTVVTSTVALTLVDFVLSSAVFGWALTQGVLPGFDALPTLPGFDFAWLFDNEIASQILVVALAISLVLLAIWVREHAEDFMARVAQAFAVLHAPVRYLRSVVFWQLCDWGLRLATIWFLLGAFGIDQSPRNVLLVQATQSLATLVPVSPGGIGTEQAFLFYVFRGEVARKTLLAFSVGMKLTITAVNVAVGFTALLLTVGTVRFRRVVDKAEAAQGAGRL